MFDTIEKVNAAVAELAAVTDDDLLDVEGSTLGDAIVQVDSIIGRLEAARLTLIRAHSRSTAWKKDGARSPAQWHRDRRRVSPGRAARDVDTARALSDLPRTAAGVADGTVSASQASIAARARRGLTAAQTDELDALTARVAPGATERQLREAVDDFSHGLDADEAAEREARAHDRRALRIGRTGDGGWWIDGRLDTLGGAALSTALSSLSAPRGDDDPRTSEQRRSDALVDLAERALRAGELPIEGGRRPAVSATADIATLERRAGAPAGRAAHGGPISAEAVRQLACDATIHRVITRGASEVLDVGRGSRVVTIAQRRALAVRDEGCVGCGAPPGWTDAHHIVHWVDGGATDLANLALLCRACHTGVHHRRWRVVQDAETGRYRVHRPPRWQPSAGRPRRDSDSTTPPHRTPGSTDPPRRASDTTTPPHRTPGSTDEQDAGANTARHQPSRPPGHSPGGPGATVTPHRPQQPDRPPTDRPPAGSRAPAERATVSPEGDPRQLVLA